MDIQATPVAEFHIVVRGSCWLRMPGLRAPIPLHGGDLVAFPRGDPHALLDSPASAARPAEEIIRGQSLAHYGPVTYGGDGLPATVLCGYFEIDREHPHPLVSALPSLIHIRGTDSEDFAWLKTTIQFMIQETRTARPGADAVVNRLAEVLFVQMVRAYIVQTGTPPGMLAAIADKPIGSALQLMHQSPQEPWSLESLSRRVGMSRSAFAARFNQLVGQTPMHYLTFWRMQKARELLRESPLSTAAIAGQVGYQSEAAFSKVFKKTVGAGPGRYRRSATDKQMR